MLFLNVDDLLAHATTEAGEAVTIPDGTAINGGLPFYYMGPFDYFEPDDFINCLPGLLGWHAERATRVFCRGEQLVEVCAGKVTQTFTVAPTGAWNELVNFVAIETIEINEQPRVIAKRISLPTNIGHRLLVQRSWPGALPLRGTSGCPLLAWDGTVRSQNGYDPASQYWLQSNVQLELPEPTREAAELGLQALHYLLTDFPFASARDRAAAVAAILTSVAQHLFPSIPAFFLDATRPATGKTLVAQIPASIAHGAPPDIQQLTKSEELEKVLTAEAQSASHTLLFDNAVGAIKSAALEAVLTCRGKYRARILGKTLMVSFDWSPMVSVTGNNLMILGDLYRRLVYCKMHYAGDAPESRKTFTIKEPLIAHVLQHRQRYLSAALTILRAFIAAGMPDQEVRCGTFEEWAQLVPSALVWLGQPNILDAQTDVKHAAGSDDARLEHIISAWWQTFRTRRLSTSELSEAILEPSPQTQDFSNAFLEQWRREDLVPATLGYKLRWLKGRVIKGCSLTSETDKHSKAQRWFVMVAPGQTLIEIPEVPERAN